MTNAVIPADFESAWLAERGDLLVRAATVTTVNNDYSLEVAGEVQTAISKAVKRLESERKSITAPLEDANALGAMRLRRRARRRTRMRPGNLHARGGKRFR